MSCSLETLNTENNSNPGALCCGPGPGLSISVFELSYPRLLDLARQIKSPHTSHLSPPTYTSPPPWISPYLLCPAMKLDQAAGADSGGARRGEREKIALRNTPVACTITSIRSHKVELYIWNVLQVN